ncbi:hypothetical protein [Vibrio japonicus]|uniref:Uncharacterized protein n=1 Tax=Vibrio japonicus TaxID=1824638 RepID=A0ABY5LK64_9VIBR|nr:hypothetical protein [Vibrio japonicus]UUM31796.1 hypothetical protein NP165_06600 [Vibrio japonicus]
MKPHFIILLSIISVSVFATDDAAHNPIAKKLKKRVVKELSKHEVAGYCDIFIELVHDKQYAKVKKVRGTGDHQVCKVGKRVIKRGERFKYKHPEKFIRVHVSS